MDLRNLRIGLIGVGAMGRHYVKRLLSKNWKVSVFDIDGNRTEPLAKMGAECLPSVHAVVDRTEIVLTSLPSSEVFCETAEFQILPHARKNQVFLDLGTAVPSESRRISGLFAEKGAHLLDIPVSGGTAGAARGHLRMFAGGNRTTLERVRPLLEVIGGEDRITYCGEAGTGQILKAVNQLKSALISAARMESLAFALLSGIDVLTVHSAFSAGDPSEASMITQLTSHLLENSDAGKQWGVKFRELPYYLREAETAGFNLPLTQALYGFCNDGERVVVDDGRPAPSFWHELLKAKVLPESVGTPA